MDDLAGKVAVVTGGARGVGLGLARAFAEQRMPIVLADIDEPTLQDAVASLRAAGAQAIGVATDVSDADAVAHLRDAAFEQFGTVQVLCNNATGGGGGPFCEPINVAAWEAAMAATVYSVLHGLNAFLPRIARARGRAYRQYRLTPGTRADPDPGRLPARQICRHHPLRDVHAELAEQGGSVGVTVLTPGGVRTEGILSSLAHYEQEEPKDPAMREFLASRVAAAVEPIELGRLVVRAIRARVLYVNTHKETLSWLRERFDRIAADVDLIGTLR
jgi:NAD(P)-dependent dehydrogenase (short-subunit alcohol dehydrogenase family)